MSNEKAPLPWGHMVRSPNVDYDSLVHVSRDPCPKCGVRGDLGCRHRKATSHAFQSNQS